MALTESMNPTLVQEMVDKVVACERERCAKIAEKYQYAGDYSNWSQEIAEEIRKGE